MDKYKLVPVEPTPEMIDAARAHHEGEAYLPVSLYKAMLAAAPAVQGELVAVMYEDGSLLSKADCGDNFEICCKAQTPLYTTQRPAVQGEPVAEVVWPDVESRRGGFRQFGHSSSPRLPAGTKLYMHPQPAEQQPALDVSALVEVMESVVLYHSEVEDDDGNLKDVREALAAHRKQGGSK